MSPEKSEMPQMTRFTMAPVVAGIMTLLQCKSFAEQTWQPF